MTHTQRIIQSVTLLALFCPALAVGGVLQTNDRVVFVGDSITGQGWRGGFIRLFNAAMKDAHPESTLDIVPLGGSGQTVGSWLNVEKNSRTKDSRLDVKDVSVKESLSRHTDVLIVMLGMNDILSPAVSADPKSLDAWNKRYATLLDNLRKRLTPRVVALATVTLCTEDPKSAKNRLADQLNERIVALAKKENCLLLDTRRAMQDALDVGRTYRPDFHVLGDYVHPNGAGHLSIAQGMLAGLGENAAATWAEKKLHALMEKQAAKSGVSYTVEPLPASLDTDKQSFLIRCWLGGGKPDAPLKKGVTLTAPAGWTVTQTEEEMDKGVFRITGAPDRLRNILHLDVKADGRHETADIVIPTPWRVMTGIKNNAAWSRAKYSPEKDILPDDDAVAGGNIKAISPPSRSKAAPVWRRHFPSVDYTGGANPGSLDFAGDTVGVLFEAAYAVRWIYSDKERPIQLVLGTRVFAGSFSLTTWLNGKKLYSGAITSEKGRKVTVDTTLKAGWNRLAIKSNHLQWQWQVSVGLESTGDDNLADLRVSTCPPD